MFASGYPVFKAVGARLIVCASVLWMIGVPQAQASFHLWDINEVYSNADGSVQYVELFTSTNSQQFTNGRAINTQSSGLPFNSFTFPGDTPSPTGGHHLLLATPGFAALPGAVTPDFTLPAGPFFDPDALTSTIDFVFADLLSFSATDLPTDGVLSLNRDLTTGTNSPTNFAGQTGLLSGTPPLTGDLDDDGFVGITDLNLVLGNWNLNVPPAAPAADPSGDGFIGIEDLNVVLGNWNAGTPPLGGAAVPEPATLTLFGLATLALLRRRV